MKRKKQKVTRLNKEIEVKNFIIKELLMIVSKNKIILPENLIKNIELLFAGEKKNETNTNNG